MRGGIAHHSSWSFLPVGTWDNVCLSTSREGGSYGRIGQRIRRRYDEQQTKDFPVPVVHINNRGVSTVNDKTPAGAEAMDWTQVISARSHGLASAWSCMCFSTSSRICFRKVTIGSLVLSSLGKESNLRTMVWRKPLSDASPCLRNAPDSC